MIRSWCILSRNRFHLSITQKSTQQQQRQKLLRHDDTHCCRHYNSCVSSLSSSISLSSSWNNNNGLRMNSSSFQVFNTISIMNKKTMLHHSLPLSNNVMLRRSYVVLSLSNANQNQKQPIRYKPIQQYYDDDNYYHDNSRILKRREEEDSYNKKQTKCFNNNNNNILNQYSNYQYCCYYHTTSRQEILPFIAIGAIVLIGRYSYRAYQRMDIELDDYNYELQKYEKSILKNNIRRNTDDNNNESDDLSSSHLLTTTIGIDFGTMYTKISCNIPYIQMIITREGDRSFFNGIMYDSNPIHSHKNNSHSQHQRQIIASGRKAIERFYFEDSNHNNKTSLDQQHIVHVTLPYPLLASSLTHNNDATIKDESLTQVIYDIMNPYLNEVLDRVIPSSTNSNDNSNNDSGSSMIRFAITVPVWFLSSSSSSSTLHRYQTIFQNAIQQCIKNNSTSTSLSTSNHHNIDVTLLPEPIATIYGARICHLIPDTDDNIQNIESKENNNNIFVIDVGGLMTQCSMIHNDAIMYSQTIPWGGETILELIIQQIRSMNTTSSSPLTTTHTNTNDNQLEWNDERSLSALQYHIRNGLIELNTKTRIDIHIPYVFANPKQHHFNIELSRKMIEQYINHNITTHLFDDTDNNDNDNIMKSLLSTHIPKPNDLHTLWLSIITKVLESSNIMPLNIQHILIVGDTTKLPFVYNSIKDALYSIMGTMIANEKIISLNNMNQNSGGSSNSNTSTVNTSMIASSTELTTIGAATMLPSYTYSIPDGRLVRTTR